MTQPAPRTRLEQRVQLAHLSLAEFVTRFRDAALECGEKHAAISERQAQRWLAGEASTPRPVCRRVLEHWWQEPVARLLGPPESSTVAVGAVLTEEELIVNAGRESMEHALDAASVLDPSALEHLHSATRQAASVFYQTPPLTMFTDLVRLRDIAYEQLDRTSKPRQRAELYLVAGQVCGLLAAVCINLGHLAAAQEQARAAHTYGSLVDNPTLCAWAREYQTHIAFWTGHPRRAASLAAASLDAAPAGITRAALSGMQARVLSSIGARQEVRAALDAAEGELQRAGGDPFFDVIGAELIYDHPRHTAIAGSSFLALGEGEQAEAQASTALQLFSDVPEHDRWVEGESAVRVDLATARVLRDDLAGAQDALGPVFAVRPALLGESVARRLANLGHLLGSTRYRNAGEAASLGEAIEHFTAHRLAHTALRAITNPTG